jgi:molybdenum cofactor biosynthesis protein B
MAPLTTLQVPPLSTRSLRRTSSTRPVSAARNSTPEAVAPLLDKTIDGFGELFRVLSYETIGTSSLQSRCLAGVANGTLIFVLPGSLDAVTTAWNRLIGAQLDASTRPCNLVQLLPRLRE